MDPEPTPASPQENSSLGTVSPPNIGPDGKPRNRAVSTAQQAHSIAKNLKDNGENGRVKTAAVVLSKYNGDPPFSEKDITGQAQAWRANFSTNFLGSIVDRIKPQILDPIKKATTLTHSRLPDNIEGGAEKSRKFGEIITKIIRRWPEWEDHCSGIVQEDVLFGVATPCWMDGDWRPQLFGFGECYFPAGCGQHAKKVPLFMVMQRLMLHEFIDLFRDQKLAKKAGYDIDGCIKVANKATTESKPSDHTPTQSEDMKREGYGKAEDYGSEARFVDLYHVVVQDYTGEVDLWTVSQNDGTEVRNVENLHQGDGMDGACTLYTFQSGNRKLYGSKGLGRLLANLHIAIERMRCLAIDQLYLSGLVIFQTDEKDSLRLQAKVRHPFVFVPSDMKLVEQVITFDKEAFLETDQKLSNIAESIAGAFIPPNLDNEGSSNTKIEAAQKAEREMAVKEGVLGRFFTHFADEITTMQRKICSPQNLREAWRAWEDKKKKQESGLKVIIQRAFDLLKKAFGNNLKEVAPEMAAGGIADEEAVNGLVELFEAGLSREEVAMLAVSPASATTPDEGAEKDNRTLGFLAANRQLPSPYVNQRAAIELEATILMGEDRANQLIIPEEDPNITNAAIRQQTIETSEMMDGNPIPVVGSDNHAIHRKTMAAHLEAVMQSIATAPTPEMFGAGNLMISHYVDHLQQDTLTGEEEKAQEEQILKQWFADLKAGEKALQEAAAQMQAQGGAPGAPGANGADPGLNGAPPAPGAEQDPNAREEMALKGAIETRKLDQADHKLSLDEQKLQLQAGDQQLKAADQEHRHAKESAELQVSNVKVVQDIAGQAHKQGMDEAMLEEQKIARQQAAQMPKTDK